MRAPSGNHDLEPGPFSGVEDMVGTKIPMNKSVLRRSLGKLCSSPAIFYVPFPWDGVLLLGHRATRPISLIAEDNRDY